MTLREWLDRAREWSSDLIDTTLHGLMAPARVIELQLDAEMDDWLVTAVFVFILIGFRFALLGWWEENK